MKKNNVLVYISILIIPLSQNAPNILWTRNYSGEGATSGFSIMQIEDENFIISGCKGSQVSIINNDRDGDTLWTNTF